MDNYLLTAVTLLFWLGAMDLMFGLIDSFELQDDVLRIFISAVGIAASIYGVGKLIMFIWGW